MNQIPQIKVEQVSANGRSTTLVLKDLGKNCSQTIADTITLISKRLDGEGRMKLVDAGNPMVFNIIPDYTSFYRFTIYFADNAKDVQKGLITAISKFGS